MNAYETTAMLHGLIRLRHESGRGEWAVFEEFQPGTGSSRYSGRRWDVLAIHCWGSSKGHRVCYEVKASRSDWLKELSDPGKRDFARSICHQCWIATVPDIVKEGELPDGWGLLVAHGSVFRTVRAATQVASVETPDVFVAALARRGAEDGRTAPKPPPRGAWKFAGQDIAEADLVDACRKIIKSDDDSRVAAKVARETTALLSRVKRLEDFELRVLESYNEQNPDRAVSEWNWKLGEWLRKRLIGVAVDADSIADELSALATRIRRGTMAKETTR